jgi:hypothetical protein
MAAYAREEEDAKQSASAMRERIEARKKELAESKVVLC